jgi:hypothetical protein
LGRSECKECFVTRSVVYNQVPFKEKGRAARCGTYYHVEFPQPGNRDVRSGYFPSSHVDI